MRLEQEIVVEAPREEVWALVADPTLYPRFMAGISHFDRKENEGGPTDRGARYSMHMHVGSAEIGGLVEIVECDPPNDLAWTSITGIDQRGRWRLRDAGDGCTRVVLRLSYGAPGALVGAVADRLSAPQARQNLSAASGDSRQSWKEERCPRPGAA